MMRARGYYQNRLTALLTLFCLGVVTRQARADVTDNYRFTAFPYYTFSNHITVYAQLGYQFTPNQTQTYNLLSPGMHYAFNPWLELWAGLNDRFNNNSDEANTFLFRPFIGPKLSVPNKWKLNLYNFTQYEYRATKNLSTDQWSFDNRVRSRFEVNVPLTSIERAWQPQTWYTITSVEPFYDINEGQIIQVRVSGGLGYVLSRRFQLEFLYYAQFARSNGGPLEYNENIFRFNLKVALSRNSDAKEASALR